jgi:hypothetical protein
MNKVTLNQLFSSSEGSISKDIQAQFEASGAMAPLREALAQEAKGLSCEVIAGKIIEGLTELLNINLEDILVGAWKKYQELRKYGDKNRYPSNETYLVHLVEHTIKSEHRPYMAVLINGVELPGKIEFALSVILTVKGAALKIRDGKIKEIMPGSCEGKGTLAWGESVLLKQETRALALPASISLGEGVPIPA